MPEKKCLCLGVCLASLHLGARRELVKQEGDFAQRRKDAKIRKDFFSQSIINCVAQPNFLVRQAATTLRGVVDELCLCLTRLGTTSLLLCTKIILKIYPFHPSFVCVKIKTVYT
jgi:hypothetical protein